MNILLVEDDTLFAETLADFLEDEGFCVTHAVNGEVALDFTFKNSYDLYLLDINIPLLNGIELLQELRSSYDNTPSIYITSYRDKSMLEKAFKSGCDDYIKKPFDLDELLWRIKAKVQGVKKSRDDFIIESQQISYKGKRVELSVSELKILKLLLENADTIVSKEMIEDLLWSSAQSGSQGSIRVYITRIKKVIPEINITNIRGVGYRYESKKD